MKKGIGGMVLVLLLIAGNIHAMKQVKDIAQAAEFGTYGVCHFISGAMKAIAGRYFSRNIGKFIPNEYVAEIMENFCAGEPAIVFTKMESTKDFRDGKTCFYYAGKKLIDSCKEKKENKEKKD